MATILYGWGEIFNLPSASPFVMKADIQLQMLGIAFERALADLETVPKHKAPYVRDDGDLIEDSTFIRWHFEKKLGRDLDAGLRNRERAQSWALERMFEHRVVPIMASERWAIDENFDRGPRMFFQDVPEAMREAAVSKARANFAASMYAAGFGRFSRAERMRLVRTDIKAASEILGHQQYFAGDRPTAIDGAAYGTLASCATRHFESELAEMIEDHPNVVEYLQRMRAQFFPKDRWPKF